MENRAKSKILARYIENENLTHSEVAEQVGCSRSMVSKAVAGQSVGEWFWKEVAAKLDCYELSRYLFDEKFAELMSLKEMLWEKEKAPGREPDAELAFS